MSPAAISDLISYGFLTPPAVFITLCLAGGLLAVLWRGFGIALVILSAAALYATAMPVVASYLLQQVETGIPESADLTTDRRQITVVFTPNSPELAATVQFTLQAAIAPGWVLLRQP